MKTIKLLSWNVNGIRAVYKKGFLQWFNKNRPDILCVQETKASPDQLPEELREMVMTTYGGSFKAGKSIDNSPERNRFAEFCHAVFCGLIIG